MRFHLGSVVLSSFFSCITSRTTPTSHVFLLMDPTDRPQFIEHVHKSLPLTVNDVKWVPSSARFVMIGSYPKNTGALHMYQLAHGELKTLVETEKPHAFKCCTFGASSIEERHLATGDFAGNLNIWDLERPATALCVASLNPRAFVVIVTLCVGTLSRRTKP